MRTLKNTLANNCETKTKE